MDFQSIKAVVFDLDGTLLDTLRDIAAAANQALRQYGLPEHPVERYRAYVGHGIRGLFQQALPAGCEAAEQILASYLEYYPEHCTDLTVFFPGIPEMLRALQGRYTLGVLSNKTERTAKRIMDHYFPPDLFRLVWGNDGRRPLKPDPAAGPLLCEALGVGPEEILFFGDGDTDMEFASRAGFLPVACSWGYRSREELEQAGARYMVDRAEQLTKMLQ
ncbi:MAG: HAD family hydrolase [Oscillospiraceae bacterium]|nr:HAD family hydrolase [Oscillospiraceae bacterium]